MTEFPDLEQYDVVEIEWANDGSDQWHCPVCGQLIYDPFGELDCYCENCGSSFQSVSAVEIQEIGDKQVGLRGREVKSAVKNEENENG